MLDLNHDRRSVSVSHCKLKHFSLPWPHCVLISISSLFFCFWSDSPQWDTTSSLTRFLDHTQRRTTVGRTPLDEWSARRRDLYLTTHNNHNRQTDILPPLGFEPTISAGERTARPATGTGFACLKLPKLKRLSRNTKCKVHLRTGYEDSEECKYSSTLPLTSTLDGGGWLMSRPGRFNLR